MSVCASVCAESCVLAVIWTTEGADRLVLFHGPAGGCGGRPGYRRPCLPPPSFSIMAEWVKYRLYWCGISSIKMTNIITLTMDNIT